MIEKYKKEIKKWEEKLEELLSKKQELISNVAKNKNIREKGVYAISKPDTNEIVYVGKTKTKTIQGRMYDHLKHKHGDSLGSCKYGTEKTIFTTRLSKLFSSLFTSGRFTR